MEKQKTKLMGFINESYGGSPCRLADDGRLDPVTTVSFMKQLDLFSEGVAGTTEEDCGDQDRVALLVEYDELRKRIAEIERMLWN